MFRSVAAPLFCALFGTTLGALYTDPSQLNGTTYDFVVVGAGTSGNVIAGRLSENPAVKVLVIEAGVSNTGYKSDLLSTPFYAPQASVSTPFDWNYTTTPQPGLNDQAIAYSRGFVLGGSSSTNFLAWTRGSCDDYDRWADVIGNDQFSFDNMVPYLKKSEKHVAPADGHDDAGEYDPWVHGTKGPVDFSVTGYLTNIDSRVIATTQELSHEFPFNQDTSSGYPLGIGWQQSSIGYGLRSSSATAYLTPAANRSNLDILIETRVTKLVQTGTSNGLPEFKSVVLAQTATGPRYTLSARREIVLSAGSIGTPQILMLSGIGNASELAAVGIAPLVSLPAVGKNLQDHPVVSTQWQVPDDAPTFDDVSLGEDPAALTAALALYDANKTGLLTYPGGNHMGFFRLPEDSPILAEYGDHTAGPVTPHFELAWQDGFVSVSQAFPTSGKYLSNINVVVSPTSRGYVALNSSDPFTPPIIDPNFFETDLDMAVMVYAVKAAQRFLTAEAWAGYVVAPYSDLAPVYAANSSDAAIEAYVRQFTASIKHPTSTASASKEPGEGVVGADLAVKNVTGVRVVDASVFPYIPSAHPQAAIYGLGELAADMIKAAHGI